MRKNKLNKQLLGEYLYDREMFDKKWNIDRMAAMFGVTRRTIYNYISLAKEGK